MSTSIWVITNEFKVCLNSIEISEQTNNDLSFIQFEDSSVFLFRLEQSQSHYLPNTMLGGSLQNKIKKNKKLYLLENTLSLL